MKLTAIKIKEFLDNNQISCSEVKEIPVYANQVFHIKGDQELFLKTFSNVEACRKLKDTYESLENKLPVPKVIFSGDETSKLGIPFVILTNVEGQEIAKINQSDSQDELVHIYQEFGETVAKLHQNTFKLFGGYDGSKVTDFHELTEAKSTTQYGPFQTWKSMHKQIILARLEILQNGYFGDMIEEIKDWFEDNSHLVNYSITPRLLHIDLNEKNVFVNDNKISGLIDFDDCFVGHNEEELMRIEEGHFTGKPELKDAFFTGYTKYVQLDKGYEQRRPYYHLSRMLVHMTCIQEYKENYVKDIEKEVAKVKSEALNIIAGKDITYEANTLE